MYLLEQNSQPSSTGTPKSSCALFSIQNPDNKPETVLVLVVTVTSRNCPEIVANLLLDQSLSAVIQVCLPWPPFARLGSRAYPLPSQIAG